MAPLTTYVRKLQKLKSSIEVPYFDPLDGGGKATTLFLFEKPGRMTSEDGSGKRPGSGFISRNNDDLTAEYTFTFMQEAGIPREKTIIWNVVPWWNGKRKVAARELSDGCDHLMELIGLLRNLKAMVFVGRQAARAAKIVPAHLKCEESAHPSPIVRATRRDRWDEIPLIWKRAYRRTLPEAQRG